MAVGRAAEAAEPSQARRAVVDSVAGAIAGGVSRTATSPLDVIKIRFQVQLEPTASWALQQNVYGPSKYTGLLQAAKDILREEGLLGFWRGNVPEDQLHLSPYLSYVSGALAGSAATVGSYPFDLLRTILASQGEPKVYPNMRSAFVDIIRTRGVLGLYYGLSPTLVEIVPYAGLQFGLYDTFKRWMMAWNRYWYSHLHSGREDNSVSKFQLFICGLVAGTSAKAVCHPLDVVRKRFQVEGLQRHPKYGAQIESSTYKGMHHALKVIAAKEGFGGLYKGLIPSLVKSAPGAAVTFVSFEYISDFLESILMWDTVIQTESKAGVE